TDTLRLEIRDAKGTVVARVTSADESPAQASDATGRGAGGRGGKGRGGRGGAPPRLATRQGINEFSWDLRATAGEGIVQLAPSGRYDVRLSLGSTSVSQPLQIVPDPRTSSTAATEQAHSQLAHGVFVQA